MTNLPKAAVIMVVQLLSTVHGSKELLVAPRILHVLQQELHSLLRLHVRKVFAQDKQALERIAVEKQIVSACARLREVHSRV